MSAVAVVAVIAGIGLAARLYLGRDAERRLRPDEVVDFKARQSAGRDNVFALCPRGFCDPEGDALSPEFAMGWERLRGYWREVIDAQKDIELVAADPAHRRLTYIQRTPILRFPDVITVEFVPLGEERATLAIDSRSRYGSSDLGVNRRRVTAWIELLRAMAR